MAGELGKASLDLEANLGTFVTNVRAGKGEVSSLDDALEAVAAVARVAEHELNKVKMDASRGVESKAVADRIERSVGGIGRAAKEASEHLEGVKLGAAQAAETTAAGDVIDRKLKNITGNANEARRAMESVRIAGGVPGRSGVGVGPFGSGFGRVGLLGTAIGAGVLTAPAAGPAAIGLLAGIPAFAAGAAGIVGTLALAFDGVGKAIKGDKKAFDELGPSAQQFTLTIRSLSGWFDKLKETAGSNLFPGLTAGLKAALSPGTVQAITRAVQEFAKALGSAFEAWGKYFGSAQFQQIFGPLMESGARNLGVMSKALMSLFDAVGVLARAAIPFTNWLTDTIAKGAKLADSWLRAKDATGELGRAMNEAKSSLQLVGNLVAALFHAVVSLGTALYPVAKVAVKDLTDGLNWLAQGFRDNQTLIREVVGGALTILVSVLRTAASVLTEMKPVLKDVLEALLYVGSKLADAFAQIAPHLKPVFENLDRILQALKPMRPVLDFIIAGWKEFFIIQTDVLGKVLGVVASILEALDRLGAGWRNTWHAIEQFVFNALTDIESAVLYAAQKLVEAFVAPVKAILSVASHIPYIGDSARTALNDLNSWISGKWGPGFVGILDGVGKNGGQALGGGVAAAAAAAMGSMGPASSPYFAPGITPNPAAGVGSRNTSGAGKYGPYRPITTTGNSLVDRIRQLAQAAGLDPAAVLAVASVESGGFTRFVGDNGTSFGPFQLHKGGALPKGQGYGFAMSDSGLQYAIRQIAQVAAGLTGQAAIQAIVNQFERPANKPAEISAAGSRYSQYGGTSDPTASVFGSLPPWTSNLGPKPPAPSVIPAAASRAEQLASANASRASALGNIGATAKRYLELELSDLEVADKELKKKLAGATGKARNELQAEITKVENNMRSVQKQIKDAIIITGEALLPEKLKQRLSKEMTKYKQDVEYAQVLTGDAANKQRLVILADLKSQHATLEAEADSTRARIAKDHGKQRQADRDELATIQKKLADVQSAIHDALIVMGDALLPAALRAKLKAQTSRFTADSDLASVLTGQAATAYAATLLGELRDQQSTLKDEVGALKAKLAHTKGAQKAAVQQELDAVNQQLDGVNQQILASLQGTVQTLQTRVSTAFSAVTSQLDAAFEAKTQAMIDEVAKRDYQGTLTPLEAQLAGMQTADTQQSLQDALDTAKAQLKLDQDTVGVTAEQLAADQKAITQAQRAIDENDLAIRAAAERAAADADYAAQTKQIQADRAKAEAAMNAQLATLADAFANGTGNMGDLSAIAEKYGIQIDTETIPDFSNLSDASTDLIAAFKALSDYIAQITGTTPTSPSTSAPGGSRVGLGRGTFSGPPPPPKLPLGLPSLDVGGTVLKTGLAMVHRGETFSGVGRTLGGSGDIVLMVDGRELGRISASALSRDTGSARVAAKAVDPHLTRITKITK